MAKTMKSLPDHRAADVDSLSDLGLFNLSRAAGRTLMSMAVTLKTLPTFHCIIFHITCMHVYSIQILKTEASTMKILCSQN